MGGGGLTLAVLTGGADRPSAKISKVCCRSSNASAAPSAASCRSGSRSWPEWLPEPTLDCRSWRSLQGQCATCQNTENVSSVHIDNKGQELAKKKKVKITLSLRVNNNIMVTLNKVFTAVEVSGVHLYLWRIAQSNNLWIKTGCLPEICWFWYHHSAFLFQWV